MFFGKYIIYIRGTYQNIDESKIARKLKKRTKIKTRVKTTIGKIGVTYLWKMHITVKPGQNM